MSSKNKIERDNDYPILTGNEEWKFTRTDLPIVFAFVTFVLGVLYAYGEYVDAHTTSFTFTLELAVFGLPLYVAFISGAFISYIAFEKDLSKNKKIAFNVMILASLISSTVIAPIIEGHYRNIQEDHDLQSQREEVKSNNASEKEALNITYSKTKVHAYKATYTPPGYELNLLRSDNTHVYQWINAKKEGEAKSLMSIENYSNPAYIPYIDQSNEAINFGITSKGADVNLYSSQYMDRYLIKINDTTVVVSAGDIEVPKYVENARSITKQHVMEVLNSLQPAN